MKIETAHKILIASAIVLFLLYAVYEAAHWFAGEAPAFLRAVCGLAAAALFAFYLRSFVKGVARD